MPVRELLDNRLVFVTGKGGTGKTTLAGAIAWTWAEAGHNTVLAEIDAFRPSVTALFGTEPTYEPRPAMTNLHVCNITWREALEEWLEQTVPVQRIVKLILGNRIVQLFLDATPGVRETVILSRVLTLTERYDRVVVDLPASGHAVSLLRVPHIAKDLMRAGPIRERSEEVLALYDRPGTTVAITVLPEEMVVNETVELVLHLRQGVPELRISLLALNQASLPTLTTSERQLLGRLMEREELRGDAMAAELLLAGRWEAGLEAATEEALSRLGQEVGLPVVHFSRLGALGGFEGGPERIVRQMAQGLDRFSAAEGRA